MSQLFYYLFLKPLSYLPLPILYIFSDILFVLIYHITGYRKSVVWQNLKNSFPDKTDAELKHIQKLFFEHLCDVIVESIKLFSITLEELSERFNIKNPKLVKEYYDKKQNVILVGGHYNNWEIAAVSLDLHLAHKVTGIYSPLSNKFFNEKMAESRSRFGVQLISKSEVRRSFEQNKDRLSMIVFGADQSPTYSRRVYWTTFLNQETAVAVGTELFAAKYNYPVVFMKVNKVKRGYYEAELELLTENPAQLEDGEITALHTERLEKIIKEKPQFWLWSHKRWKRKRTEKETLIGELRAIA